MSNKIKETIRYVTRNVISVSSDATDGATYNSTRKAIRNSTWDVNDYATYNALKQALKHVK